MILFGRGKAERRRKAIVLELYALHKEFPRQSGFINDMILYAEIGKGRLSLPDDCVQNVRKECQKFEDRFARVGW